MTLEQKAEWLWLIGIDVVNYAKQKQITFEYAVEILFGRIN